MQIVHSDTVVDLGGGSPSYSAGNPLAKLLALVAGVRLAASRECYLGETLQYLFPITALTLYGPSGSDHSVLDPTQQDNKTDFQKQNVADFFTGDTLLVRGTVTSGDWTGPFVRLSYRGGPDSLLSERAGHALGASIKVWAKIADAATPTPIDVPYNTDSNRYEVELWGYPDTDLADHLDDRGKAALASGELLVRTDLVQGSASDFDREVLEGQYVTQVFPTHTMHPVLPLPVEVAWSDSAGAVWDSNDGANHHYAFSMMLRGWDHYLGVGISPNPHGGLGFLEYRNLMSNYGRYTDRPELDRQLETWQFDAFGHKGGTGVEPFFAVDYMDLHLVLPNCAIGLHRHRDNQEVFLLMEGQALMIVGDWCQTEARERCIEVRTLRAGHMAMLKGGNLHALVNPGESTLPLFMFGGYD